MHTPHAAAFIVGNQIESSRCVRLLSMSGSLRTDKADWLDYMQRQTSNEHISRSIWDESGCKI